MKLYVVKDLTEDGEFFIDFYTDDPIEVVVCDYTEAADEGEVVVTKATVYPYRILDGNSKREIEKG